MKPKILTANLIICEKVLAEDDGVHSIIRMVDLFRFKPIETKPNEKAQIELTTIAIFRLEPSDDTTHLVELWLVRPSGLEVRVATLEMKAEGNAHDAPRGFNARGTMPIEPTEAGGHYISLRVDEVEVTKAYFTLEPTRTASAKLTAN